MGNVLGNLFSWTVTALFGVITLLLAFESWALLTGQRPISDYIRPAVHSYPGYAFVAAVGIGGIFRPLLWGWASGPPPARGHREGAFPPTPFLPLSPFGFRLGQFFWYFRGRCRLRVAP